jgi:short-subunit dehydrogenase
MRRIGKTFCPKNVLYPTFETDGTESIVPAMKHDKQLGTALVTGASSGIGAIYADRLARRGYDLILVARNQARLDALAQRLTSETRAVTTLAADLGAKADLARVAAELRDNSHITFLVNNAGVGAIAPLLDTDVEKMEQLIAINVTALTRLTYAAAPAFVSRGTGTLVNIASIVAIAPEMLNGVYGASKAFVLALSQSLQHELGSKGVRVQAVLPGATATEFWGLAGRPVEHLPQEIVMTAGNVVDAALSGLDRGELVTIPSLPDQEEWDAYDTARRAMHSKLSSRQPAERFGLTPVT